MRLIPTVLFCLLLAFPAGAQNRSCNLRMSELYADHMVLQRGRPIIIEGEAKPGERVSVRLGCKRRKASADESGHWQVRFPKRKACTGLQLKVRSADEELVLQDIAVGEVWLCSGQSNMEFMVRQTDGPEADIAASADPELRLFDMKCRWRTDAVAWPADVIDSLEKAIYFRPTRWTAASPETVRDFSAIAYYFGRALRDSLGVPVGLICNAVGGSPTESWIDRETLENGFPEMLEPFYSNERIQDWVRRRARQNVSKAPDGLARHPYQPCFLYESGILPVAGYPLAGVLWYQGESNAQDIAVHERLFPLLVDAWRRTWNAPEMPFYFVQLSSLNRPTWPEFRDSQRRLAEQIPHCGMVVSSDLGDYYDVHYHNKKPVGERLALLALNDSYGRGEIVPSGPSPKSCSVKDGRVVVEFSWGEGLQASDGGAIIGFETAGRDGVFHNAQASVEGECIVLSCPEVADPAAVRYAWQPYTRANLVNGAGLPATTFKLTIN